MRLTLGPVLLVLGVLGGKLTIINGQVQSGFSLLSVVLGVGVLPAALLAWQWLRSQRQPNKLQATGTMATGLNMLVFAALLLTPLYAPPLSFTADAALVFYGASMVLAGIRGYAGCEVLAVSNWLLQRDDQIGCLVLSPIDHFERELGR